MSYYDNSQWPAAGQASWDHQTPPTRSGANSAIPRDEPAAFTAQIEEVDRAIDNLVKSGKMFGMPGRRESLLPSGPAGMVPDPDNRMGPAGPGGSRHHSISDYNDTRGPHQSNLQNFYAQQRHQTSRGSNEAEQMMQAKRRMAAQRERELRNYHQEQQYNRTVLGELSPYNNKPDRTLSPGTMSEEDRRDLIARQRSALYGEGPFADTGGYVDETGTVRPGIPGPPNGPAALRGHSPLAYEYGRPPPGHPDGGAQASDGVQGSQSAAANQRSRANSASPQSNQPGATAQQNQRTSNSSPGESPPPRGGPSTGKQPGQGAGAVAPIGTRPSGTSGSSNNPALAKQRATTPLASPLGQGYNAAGNNDDGAPNSANASNPPSAAAEGPNVGLSGWGSRSGVWGNKSGLGVQASVWG